MIRLLNVLRQRAAEADATPVLACAGGEFSAQQLLEKLDALLVELRASGIRRLALRADNGPGWAMLDIAAQLAGLVVVPIPTFFSAEQTQWVLDQAGIDGVCASRSDAWFPGMAGGDSLGELGVPDELVLARRPVPEPVELPRGTSKITFTSGSTGQPKGVCLSTSQCMAVAESLLARSGLRGARHLAILPLATLLENIAGLYMPILAGGTVILPGAREVGLAGSGGLDVPRMLSAIDHWQPNSAILVPEILRVLVAATGAGWTPPGSLRFLAVGGARVSPEIVLRARELGLPVYEGYGLSECASVVSLNAPGVDRPGTSGRILPHVSVREVDGELRISGNAFLGYLGDRAGWSPAEIASGDLGRVTEDGFLVIEGRRKNLLITSFGRNVSPEWVESELLAGGVLRQAVVFGDGRPGCCALVYPLHQTTADEAIDGAIEAANARLPDYARVRGWHRLPRPLESTPGLLTANGRPRREAIARYHREDIESLYPHEESLPQ
ncbi:AMP-binding protein [Parahaliea mediterranea]|uniref:AMP-binding protein n=1 Tax=Parahaliea mediterranea TaxID=651086 RepID=A0A939DH92_9GAMM|nr:AMP-binding protein [Parahaliea mediterranea]MBN7798100.1 AMP-binding protein [Parahaliea mediterranea]